MKSAADLYVNFSSNTNNDAIVGPNPPIICKIVLIGWEKGRKCSFVKTASAPQAIPVTAKVIIKNLYKRLVSISAYTSAKLGLTGLLHDTPAPSCCATGFCVMRLEKLHIGNQQADSFCANFSAPFFGQMTICHNGFYQTAVFYQNGCVNAELAAIRN